MPPLTIKARQSLDCRQCAEHKGREDHKEEEKVVFVRYLIVKFTSPDNLQQYLPLFFLPL
jgi:hypothetical protein